MKTIKQNQELPKNFSKSLPVWLIVIIACYWGCMLVADISGLYFDSQIDVSKINWLEVTMKRLGIRVYYFFTTLVAFWWYQNNVITVDNWKRSVLLVLFVGVPWLVASQIYFVILRFFIFDIKISIEEIRSSIFSIYSVYNYFSLWPIVFVANSFYYYRGMVKKNQESARLQLKLAKMEIMLYRAQLEPHFMFNSLNSISSLVRLDRREQATDAIAKLSALLRAVVDVGETQFMPLDWEITFTQYYIA